MMNRQTILTAITLIAFAATAYIWVQYAAKRPEAREDKETALDSPEGRLGELRRIKEITLDTSIFQDRFFQGLIELAPLPETAIQAGRTNPFEPL